MRPHRFILASKNTMYKDLFDYKDGALICKVSRGSLSAGGVAGSLRSDGYIRVCINGKRIYAHRIVYEMHFGSIPDGVEIDHINGIRNDNRIDNLRAVSKSENQLNKAKYGNNSSGFTGVSLHTQSGKWVAQFMGNYLGIFETFENASAAYKRASDGIVTVRHGV